MAKSPMISVAGRRAVPEWIADHPDQDIPRRVKERIWARCEGRCHLTGKKLRASEADFDHIKRLRDGGEHRETNIALAWRERHREKSAQEVTEGSKADRIHAKHFGYFPEAKQKLRGRGFDRRWQP